MSEYPYLISALVEGRTEQNQQTLGHRAEIIFAGSLAEAVGHKTMEIVAGGERILSINGNAISPKVLKKLHATPIEIEPATFSAGDDSEEHH